MCSRVIKRDEREPCSVYLVIRTNPLQTELLMQRKWHPACVLHWASGGYFCHQSSTAAWHDWLPAWALHFRANINCAISYRRHWRTDGEDCFTVPLHCQSPCSPHQCCFHSLHQNYNCQHFISVWSDLDKGVEIEEHIFLSLTSPAGMMDLLSHHPPITCINLVTCRPRMGSYFSKYLFFLDV